MEWNRAKNFMLIFFICVNVLLAALIRYEADTHTLTRERESAIQAVLAQHNITMYHTIPRDFAPMRSLRFTGYDYDISRLLYIFMPPHAIEAGLVTHVSDVNRNEFTFGDTSLVITESNVFFVSGIGMTGVPDLNAAIAITQAFIEEYYPDFVLDIQSTREAVRGGLRLFYRQEHQGNIIHSNFIEFLVTGEGSYLPNVVIEEVDIHYSHPGGFAYMFRELVGSDEALLSFVQSPQSQSNMLITHMDIVYYQVRFAAYAEPFYRIFIEDRNEPFLINAITNRMN